MNRSVAGAVVAVPQGAFTSARPVQQVAIRMQPNQIAAIRTGQVAPRVAPQQASVLGRAAGGNAPRPPAAVLQRPIVARTAPPAAPPSFQQRQAILAKNPGQPVSVAQMHQLAGSRGAVAGVRPPVRVESNVRPVSPQAARGGNPMSLPANHAQAGAPTPAATQPARTASRPFEPPAAQQRNVAPQHAAAPPQRQPAKTASRPFEPPAAPQHPAAPQRTPAPQQASRPPAGTLPHGRGSETAPRVQPPVQAQQRPARPAAPAPQAERQATPPRPQPHVQAARPVAPAPQAERQAERQAVPPRPQPHVQSARPAAPAPREQPRAQAPQRPAPPRPAPQRPAEPERKPEKH